jgi:hypothetical protein
MVDIRVLLSAIFLLLFTQLTNVPFNIVLLLLPSWKLGLSGMASLRIGTKVDLNELLLLPRWLVTV